MVSIITVDEENREFWDNEISKFETSHPLNAYGWGKVRAIDGWSSIYLMANHDDIIKGAVLLLYKNIPGTPFSIMYAPRGPVWNINDDETIDKIVKHINYEAKKRRAIFVRIDPNINESAFDKEDPLKKLGFKKLEQRWTFWNTPRDVYRIDISDASTEDELFKKLDRDARRCVRKAKKEGVSIKPAESVKELSIFYKIFKEFTINKGFMSRGEKYQQALWDEYIDRGNGRLFLACYHGKIIGGLICIAFGKKCLAMHMGTPYKYQKLQTYYAYVWESIKWAWESGCKWYSFRGVGTTKNQERFKKKFNPKIMPLVGYYDMPIYPSLYQLAYWMEFEFLPRIWRLLMLARKTLIKNV